MKGNTTQVDYIPVKNEERKNLRDAKVLPHEAVTRQHRLLVADIEITVEKKSKASRPKPRIKVWKMKEKKQEYRENVAEMRRNRQREANSIDEEWEDMSRILKEAAKKVCGMTKGKAQTDKEKWWWNEKVQKTEREVYKKLKDGTGNYEQYKRLKQKAKKAVAKAKESAWKVV